MKSKACCWILLILGIGFLLFIGVVVAGIFGVSALLSSGVQEQTAIADGSYLLVDISGTIDETRVTPPLRRALSGDGSPTMAQILIALKRAAKDHRIEGVILRPAGTRGFAELREIREAVFEFKKSGKPVYAYLEIGTDRDYYLASAADSIIVFPAHSGGLFLEGIGSSSTYLAKTFEKFGIKFHVLHAGAYKGAYENLSRESMSPEIRESLQFVLDDIFETYVNETDSARAALHHAAFRNELLNGPSPLVSGETTVARGFADRLSDWEDFSAQLAGDDELQTVEVEDLAHRMPLPAGKKHIAVVFAEGEITYSLDGAPLGGEEGIESDAFVERLRDLRDDDDVQAVVLRVNSPGGSALASEVILREVERLRKTKPVVISMGRVAASGGYYISCGANWIVAQPNTITGSIGVVSAFPTAEGLYDKFGANVEVVKKGKWAEFLQLDKTMTAEQEAVLTGVMSDIYDDFKRRVSEGRDLSLADVENVAQGRIWTGKQALDRNLVDELGGIREAVAKAAELAKIDSANLHVKYYVEREDIFHYIMRRLRLKVQTLWNGSSFLTYDPSAVEAQRLLQNWLDRREFVQLRCPLQVQ